VGGLDDVPSAPVRPSGHHAQPARVDGFCFFDAAVAVEAALTDRSVDRVAVVDWDVHHGNGTQAVCYDRADVLAVSVHDDHRSGPPTPTRRRVRSRNTARTRGKGTT
jgi:acetoin utilization deacetylase AcuC-like enzyme